MKTRTLLVLCALLLPFAFASARDKAEVRLYVFDCGHMEIADVSMFGIDRHEPKQMVDSCYLIVHPKGKLIWDTGLSDDVAQLPDHTFKGEGFAMQVTNPLAAQLQQIGIAPDDITYLGISHMHSDHVGNTKLFPKATLLMQKEEYEAGFGPTPEKYGFDPKQYPTLGANPVEKLEGDRDVFGDGRVVIKREPGHTPGHQALFVKLKKTGNVLLSGDLVHLTENWTAKRVPPFNYDKEQSLKTMSEVDAFLKANKAQLWIQHDKEQNDKIRHAPGFYE